MNFLTASTINNMQVIGRAKRNKDTFIALLNSVEHIEKLKKLDLSKIRKS